MIGPLGHQPLFFLGALLGILFACPSAAAKLPNSASCIYDGISVEEKEIAIVMLFDEIASGFDGSIGKAQREEIKYLLEESHNRCLDLYPWVTGESGNAMLYAMFALTRDAVGDFLKIMGKDPAPVESYYQANQASYLKTAHPRDIKVDSEDLGKHLAAAGWSVDDAEILQIATGYVVFSAMKDQTHADFRRGVYY